MSRVLPGGADSALSPGWGQAVSLEEVRRWTRGTQRRRRRLTRSVAEDLTDIYTAVLAVLVIGAMAAQGLSGVSIHGQGAAVPTWQLGLSLDPVWLTATALLLLPVGAGGALRRLGPVYLRLEQAVWWLPLPGARGGLLTSAAAHVGLVLSAVAVALSVSAAVALGGGWPAAAALSLLGLGSVGLLVAGLVSAQAAGRGTTRVRLGFLAAASVSLAVSWWGPGAWGLDVLGGAGLLALAAVPLWWQQIAGCLEQLDDAALLESSRQAFGLRVAGLGMDSREIGRLLAPPLTPPHSRARLGLARLAVALPPAGRCALGVAQADWLVLRRQPWRLAAITLLDLVAAALPWLGLVRPWLAAAWLALSWLTVLLLADPARRACFDPGVDELWPASPAWVRFGHLLVPMAAMVAWQGIVGMCLWYLGGVLEAYGRDLLLLLLAAGIGWGAVVVSSGMRTPADWSVIIPTPFGAIPQGLVESLVVGPDAAVIVAIPMALLLLGGVLTPFTLGMQAVCSAAVLAWAIRVNRG